MQNITKPEGVCEQGKGYTKSLGEIAYELYNLRFNSTSPQPFSSIFHIINTPTPYLLERPHIRSAAKKEREKWRRETETMLV
jgi:hypothetical protein